MFLTLGTQCWRELCNGVVAQSPRRRVSLRFNPNTPCWDSPSCLMQTRTHEIFTQAAAAFWTHAQLWLKRETASYAVRNGWEPWADPELKAHRRAKDKAPFSLLPGKSVVELAVPQPALETRVTLQGAAGGLCTNTCFNLSLAEFSLFERLVCVCGKWGLQPPRVHSKGWSAAAETSPLTQGAIANSSLILQTKAAGDKQLIRESSSW